MKRMRYISICSGIEAASVAWAPLGWHPVSFSEIDAFPSAVLAHHYPQVQNLGDITQVDWRAYAGKADIVVGGTPCQSFSAAGKRHGMDDARGQLSYVFVGLVQDIKPIWFIWENVPGVLSSGGGRDFKALCYAFNDIGYHIAWRVLDAQFFGVPQRRRRVFVVGHIGDWRRAAEVLLESESVRGCPQKRQNTKRDLAGTLTASYGSTRGAGLKPGNLTIAKTLLSAVNKHKNDETYVVHDEAVRRLTPLECERLQGFPDNWTQVPYRGGMAKDTPRYKAIGNSMAVPVVRWIGERIGKVHIKNTCQALKDDL